MFCPSLFFAVVPQVIWVCILCRKKQELVVKTGKWILPSVPGSMQQQQQQQSIGGFSVSGLLINDKKPRLERAISYDREYWCPPPELLPRHPFPAATPILHCSVVAPVSAARASPIPTPPPLLHRPTRRNESHSSDPAVSRVIKKIQ